MPRKTEETEIYRYAHKVNLLIIDIVKNMNNSFKSTLGDRLMSVSLDILLLVFDSNENSNKMLYLEDITKKISVLSVLLRLCSDSHLCNKIKGVVE